MTRLVITGMGAVTPLGVGVAALLDGWRAGQCALREVTRFDASALTSRIGGEMPDDGASGARGEGPLAAALGEALERASLPADSDVLLLFATTKGLLDRGDAVAADLPRAHPRAASDFAARILLRAVGRAPRVLTITTACASGTTALALAAHLAAAGRVPDAVVCAGVDLLSDFVFRGFAALSAIDPRPCRPFDRSRAGLSPSEAAAAMVLVPEASARARGAAPFGRLLGGGISNDAAHPTAPDRDGAGLVRAAVAALLSAGVGPEDLGHVHAHGTGTVRNDAAEIAALRRILGGAASATPVTTLKGSIGHPFGPAGLVETIASVAAVRAGVVPPIAGLEDPEPGLRLVRGEGERPRSPRFLKTSAGFGGFDAAVVVEALSP